MSPAYEQVNLLLSAKMIVHFVGRSTLVSSSLTGCWAFIGPIPSAALDKRYVIYVPSLFHSIKQNNSIRQYEIRKFSEIYFSFILQQEIPSMPNAYIFYLDLIIRYLIPLIQRTYFYSQIIKFTKY